ncbi:protein-tyrosine phosphatase family protein [Sediminispirochaeta bajacaliforniensis]|uniref:protein-tyrosine phosphatase family protein n=1 Tax=Sediminispirochaeta bajacaliforniensis TaxID=148 RepID=UPI0003826FB2|nr:protein-tyrosine phosphatase family protein [Sediminispirochaeta bajacaliforniensis]
MPAFPRIDCLEIEGSSSLYLGAHPFEGLEEAADTKQKCERLEEYITLVRSLFIETFVVLLPEMELQTANHGCNLLYQYRNRGLSVVYFPIENFGVPDAIDKFDELLKTIAERLEKAPVLVHCLSGCGRTGMVASGFLIRLGSNVEDAIARVNRVHPKASHTVKQILFLKEYRKWLKQRNA